jgi:pimeloyl-ACP methyl ester carboxylesterase
MVEELHILLRRSGTPGPYVLVGHSYGGLLARLFTHLYRDEVAGLVLVDSMHEDQFGVFGPAFPPAAESDPPALREFREFWTNGWRRTDSTTEGIDLPASIAQGRTIRPFGDLPMRVLTAGAYLNQPLAPAAMRPVLQGMWNQLQAQFLELSDLAEPIYVESSGHFVQRDDPDAVIDAVCQVVAQVRAGGRR